ncbi:MAG: hypothetical protein IPM35_19770 [Myxococcales bacterium]|nr:hypothetical protein [Myxococcales bacterium]
MTARALHSCPDNPRDPSVVVRDASGDRTLRPPPVSRRRLRVQTLPGLGESADEYRASLLPVAADDFSAVDELLASFDFPAE